MKTPTRYIVLFGIIAVLTGLFIWNRATPGRYDALADCLKEKQVIFYGAFWCPHCNATKQAFGKSAKRLPYIECSTPDGKSQLPICADQNITGYPTWVFPDGTRLTGEVELTTLAEKSSCPIQ